MIAVVKGERAALADGEAMSEESSKRPVQLLETRMTAAECRVSGDDRRFEWRGSRRVREARWRFGRSPMGMSRDRGDQVIDSAGVVTAVGGDGS